MSKENIRAHVEDLFRPAPQSQRAIELKEEMIANLEARYEDLLAQGKEQSLAYNITIAGIGDTDQLLSGLRQGHPFDPETIQKQRQRSALFISSAVALYIVSFIFPMIFSSGLFFDGRSFIIGPALMFVCWALATGLIIFNAISKPRYVKSADTYVESVKASAWNKNQEDTLYKAISSIVWMLAVITFLLLGFFANAFHPGWLVFILAVVVNQIIRLVLAYRDNPKL